MPAPLAMPTMRPPPSAAERTLGNRSVVTMPSAAGMMLPPASASRAFGSAATISSTGSPQPITPVEQGSTSSAFRPSSPPAATHRASLASTPPGAQTLEILLLMRMAPSFGAPKRRRPTITGAPGKALRVKSAAKSAVGSSSAINVSVMRAGLGASLGIKSNRALPTRKPCGRAAKLESQARCASRDKKTFWVLDTR